MASEGRNCKHFEIYRQTVRRNLDIYRWNPQKERKNTATTPIVLTSALEKVQKQKNRLRRKKNKEKHKKNADFYHFFYTASQPKSLHNMVLDNSYYFTSKIEIKPQLWMSRYVLRMNYFTSKIEIKPQLLSAWCCCPQYYFTSKIEIKPQRW